MWISKQTYDNMSDSIERLSHYQDQWNRLVYAIEHGDESCFALDGVVVVSQQLLQANADDLKSKAGTIMRLTAERDWYKQKYAELVVASEKGTCVDGEIQK